MVAMDRREGPEWVAIYLVGLLLVGFLVLVGAAGHGGLGDPSPVPDSVVPAPQRGTRPGLAPAGPARPGRGEETPLAQPPWGTLFTVHTNSRRIRPVSTAVPLSNARWSSAVESI